MRTKGIKSSTIYSPYELVIFIRVPMINKLKVGLGQRSYPILIGDMARNEVLPHLESNPCEKAVVVTDDRVGSLYGDEFLSLVRRKVGLAVVFTIPEGEKSKSFAWLESLCRAMTKSGLDRDSMVMALGGGVVGDLAGLAASVYLRGVRLIQLPTTLLSMVDSSVGGKTGINIPEGKNLVGSFYQPETVLADTSFLATLHERDWYSGLAEVIKIALTLDPGLFEYLESVHDLGPTGDLDIARIVTSACARKSEVVQLDEKEEGLRRVLNFGHTLGHGVEAAVGYGKLRHGEAILLGMKASLKLSHRMCGLPGEQQQRAVDLIERIPVPSVKIPDNLVNYIVRDKKSSGNTITSVLIREIGKYEFVKLDNPSVLVEALKEP